MVYEKAKLLHRRYYTRKDKRPDSLGLRYKTWFHYHSKSLLKPIRKVANRSLRRYKGDVSNHGWYKKYYDVMWTAF